MRSRLIAAWHLARDLAPPSALRWRPCAHAFLFERRKFRAFLRCPASFASFTHTHLALSSLVFLATKQRMSAGPQAPATSTSTVTSTGNSTPLVAKAIAAGGIMAVGTPLGNSPVPATVDAHPPIREERFARGLAGRRPMLRAAIWDCTVQYCDQLT